ncbi:MAG: branched-chain amino acid ABC transporter permease [Phycisphaerales bacterium]|nr:branched-chain amino acid ABC transporter permease [Phycisphaerales bacterium]
MAELLQIMVAVVAVGSLYALIALGYTMVYGILKFINFAHSDVFVLGAWVSLVLSVMIISALKLAPGSSPPLWIAPLVLIAAMVVCGLVGFAIERLAYKPLRKAPRLNVLITAIGVSLLLQNVGQLTGFAVAKDDDGKTIATVPFGPSPKRMPSLLPETAAPDPNLAKPLVLIQPVDVFIFVSAIVLMVGLQYLVFRTKFGAAMRAVSFNTETAALMGIRVDRVISVTFVTGAMLAAAAGFMYALKYPGLNQTAHETWVLLGLKAFVAAVVGGIGNVRGAVLGGFLIAFIEFMGMYCFSKYLDPVLHTNMGTNLRDVYVFAMLIFVLLVRPAGILGSQLKEKV